ncbi:hypothetical protein SORBI_3007G041100 [Sorghum bicolor]|uniref:FBD domain-containing protein n=1 Tax=Sorghum bicolor TaxID=4558 RepID=A0A1Z5R917_SORBI|nr:hypothetical protein SORBI_3007G041100 [Sorghum bicolor]
MGLAIPVRGPCSPTGNQAGSGPILILSHCATAALRSGGQRQRGGQSQSRRQQQQQPPPGPKPVRGHDGGGGGCEAVDVDINVDVDLLSSLHDDVLGSIITLLPTKDGARTQVLSRRWRPLWRSASAPLNLEATVVAPAAVNLRPTSPPSAVVGALRAHGGPARRVSLTWLGPFDSFPMVDGLLTPPTTLHRRGVDGGGSRFPSLDGLREFELYYKPINVPGVHRHPPPMASLRRFARTLRVLTVCSAACSLGSYNPYRLAFPPETELEFPKLEQLTLKHVSISEAALHAVLARCPALQSLVLHRNEGYGRLVIRSPTLRSLGVSHGAEVVVEDAPMLERLIPRHLGKFLRIQVVHAPRMKTLGYLCDTISEFEMGTTVLKGMVPAAGASSMIRTVKILALDSPRDLDVVIDLLKCFPCVEKLYLELCHYNVKGKVKNVRRSNVPMECLGKHLKMLELRNYRGRKSEVSLIRFFLSNARVVESVRFMVPPYNRYKGKWIVNQRKKLLLNIRASRGARFHFDIGRCLSSRVPMEHIHNLAIDDPFGRSSCSCQYDDFK